jgi:hypothetical protein
MSKEKGSWVADYEKCIRQRSEGDVGDASAVLRVAKHRTMVKRGRRKGVIGQACLTPSS